MSMLRCKRLFIVTIMISVFSVAIQGYSADNRGFIKDPSASFKEQFPRCDAFLDMRWLDPAQRIGRVSVDLYEGAAIKDRRELLVKLEKPGSTAFSSVGSGIFYEADAGDLGSGSLDTFLKGASYKKSHFGVFMTAAKGKSFIRFTHLHVPFEALADHANDFPSYSLSAFTATVCIVYPDTKQAFVIETKKPFLANAVNSESPAVPDLMRKEVQQRCAALGYSDNMLACTVPSIRDSYVLDLDGTGRDDYVFSVGPVKAMVRTTARRFVLSPEGEKKVREITDCLAPGQFFFGLTKGLAVSVGRCTK